LKASRGNKLDMQKNCERRRENDRKRLRNEKLREKGTE
jgi:hypothetical protein